MSIEENQYRLENTLGGYQALVQDVDRVVLRAALKGGMSADTRRQCVFKLQAAAEFISKIPEESK